MLTSWNWNWLYYRRLTYIFPYPYVVFIIIAKGIFTHDEEKIVAFCLIIFAIILHHGVKAGLIDIFEERSANIASEYREALSIRRGILPKMRRFWRLFQDLEDAVAHTTWLLFKKVIKILFVKNFNRSLYVQHQIKHQINLLIKKKLNSDNFFKQIKVNAILTNLKKIVLNNKLAISEVKILLNFSNINNTFYYLIKNKL